MSPNKLEQQKDHTVHSMVSYYVSLSKFFPHILIRRRELYYGKDIIILQLGI